METPLTQKEWNVPSFRTMQQAEMWFSCLGELWRLAPTPGARMEDNNEFVSFTNTEVEVT